MVKKKSLAWCVIAINSVFVAGCGHYSMLRYGPDSQPREEFEHRVEAAFRLQNAMTSEVMVLQDVSQDAGQEAILQAEQLMQHKCRYLNEYASKELDGSSSGILLLSRVEDSVADCEAAAHALQTLLKSHQGL